MTVGLLLKKLNLVNETDIKTLGDIVPDRRLTTVRFDNKRVGMWAVDKIAGAEDVAPGVEHMLIPGVLIEGDTVRGLR